jgi:hypothetical protein
MLGRITGQLGKAAVPGFDVGADVPPESRPLRRHDETRATEPSPWDSPFGSQEASA